MTTEECFQNLEDLTESSRKITRLAKEIIAEVEKVDAEHQRIGFTGMASRAEICKRADPERCDRLRDEYTDAALAAAKALMELQHLIIGRPKARPRPSRLRQKWKTS